MKALLAIGVVLVGWAWVLAHGHSRRVLLCPPQCEVQVEPAGGERLRATCWCEGGEGE